jgi:hypothetical protein
MHGAQPHLYIRTSRSYQLYDGMLWDTLPYYKSSAKCNDAPSRFEEDFETRTEA